jgi:hypothetical protein
MFGRIQGSAEAVRHARLGRRFVSQLRGTPLGNAAELDALVALNIGAPDGTHTALVEKLHTDARAGRNISAVKVVDSATLRSANAVADVSLIERQTAHAQELNEEIDQLKGRIFELEDALEKSEDALKKSEDEVAALRAKLQRKVGARP